MGTFDPNLLSFSLLFIASLFAGFVDSIAGGGGLISLPALISVGLPPQIALGTNKLQGTFGALSAAYTYARNGAAPLKPIRWGILYTFLGALLGAWAIQQMDAGFLKHLIPWLLLLVLSYTLASPRLGFKARRAIMPPNRFFLVFGLSLGFYDGFFGPGAGSFWTAAFLVLMGLEMTQASGYTKVVNFTSNIVALAMFVVGNNVLYSAGIIMAIGQIVGASVGSSLAIKKGARFIRPVFLTMVFLTLARMVYLNYA
jgi:uncharacterized membrane protein YfcA